MLRGPGARAFSAGVLCGMKGAVEDGHSAMGGEELGSVFIAHPSEGSQGVTLLAC